MRTLVVSNLYPPAVKGGYEIECSGVVDHLRSRGDNVFVLTSTRGKSERSTEPQIARALPLLANERRARLAAPFAALTGARITRDLLDDFRPDLAFVWNGAQLPHSVIQVILESGTPTAFRVCQQWLGGFRSDDRFMRHLSGETSHAANPYPFLARRLNALAPLRLDVRRETPVAISWVSAYLRGAVTVPPGLNAVLERTIYPATNRDAEFASVRRRESKTPQVVFFGRLTPEKGSSVLIEALARMSASNDAIELVIAGDGSPSDLALLRNLAVSLGVEQRCRFVGPLDTDGMCALLATATVVAVPSTWEEPFGLVLVEAALAGVPLVATRVGGIPEIFLDEEILLVAPSDKHELAQALTRTLARPEERRERARRARARAQTFMWQQYAETTCTFVDDAYRALDALR